MTLNGKSQVVRLSLFSAVSLVNAEEGGITPHVRHSEKSKRHEKEERQEILTHPHENSE
jgi:hypothetical protein